MTDLHETPLTLKNPPHIGARLGPANGASVKIANAAPRSLTFQISPIMLPEFVSGEAAMAPPRSRNMRMEAVLCERAHPIWKQK